MKQKQGLIAILDALGAASYTDKEITTFLKSRDLVLELLQQKADAKEVRGDIDSSQVATFTFNDTVLIVLTTKESASLNDVKHFCLLLRKFVLDSLAKGILFRGAVSIGKFYVEKKSNTVMGAAVTDAAAWYDSADWVGINATPLASLTIQALLEQSNRAADHLLVDYPVPLKGRSPLTMKAINWPKAFVVDGITPVKSGENRRAKCLSLLTYHGIPKGVESKHFNSIEFFDHCIKLWKDERKSKNKNSEI